MAFEIYFNAYQEISLSFFQLWGIFSLENIYKAVFEIYKFNKNWFMRSKENCLMNFDIID